ncbi:MAG: penicillin-binding protein activator [Coxiellaceae bacterium]|jgi:outer membrane PBP1 activator LpoA protein|nr:penicillin-binding protein activator [Coxiellaceae bacterium]
MLNKIKVILLGLVIILFLTGCLSKKDTWHGTSKRAEVIAARSKISSLVSGPDNIVLMLPLKGELAASSQAIRNGFLAAYYYARKEHPNINIKIVDTSERDILALYQEAVIDGAEVIVGPLTKKEVETILNISLSIPVVALNTLDDYIHNFGSNLYQFGLLPQDEAVQVAEKMLGAQHDRVAIITPKNAWGNRIVQAFQAKYKRSGGQVVAILNYNFTAHLSEQICPFLARNASQLCKRQRYKKPKGEFDEPMRRQDINAIFLVTTAKDARQIMPLLKFYYAGDLPTYAISSIYSGRVAPDVDRDINGVYFCDIPLVLQDPDSFSPDLQAIYKQIKILWASDFIKYPRLYALGVDAYNLASQLNSFVDSQELGMEGASGKLYLDDFNHIYRELPWAEIRDGVPIVLSSSNQ